MNLKARIGLLVQAQGARRAAQDIDGVARPVRRLGTETEVTGRKFREAEVKALSFRKGLIGMTSFVSAGAIGVFGLGAVLHGAAHEYQQTWKAARATNAVIASTHGIANVTATSVGDLADKLSLQAGIDNELIQKGENLLLTFRNIRNEAGLGNDIFDQTTQAAVDMSAAFTAAGKSMDVASASLQLGKALNDPAKGMGRLQRVGVSFTQSQIKQAKVLQKNGDLLGAQKIILAELTKEFGGAGAALASPFDKATVSWHDAEKQLGTALAPTVASAATTFAEFTTGVEKNTGAGGKFRGVVVGIYNAVKTLWPVIVTATAAFVAYKAVLIATAIAEGVVGAVQLVTTFAAAAAATDVLTASMVALDVAFAANPVVLIAAALAAVGAALYLAYTKVKWFHNAVNDTWSWIKGHWALLAGPFLLVIGPLVVIIKHFRAIKNVAVTVFRAVKNAVQWVIDKVKSAVGWVASLIDKLASLNPFRNVAKNATDFAPHRLVPVVPGTAAGRVINGMANGGTVTAPGLSWVGEDGPELLELPSGASVKPLTPAAPVGIGAGGTGRPLEQTIIVQLANGREIAREVRRVSLGALLAESPA